MFSCLNAKEMSELGFEPTIHKIHHFATPKFVAKVSIVVAFSLTKLNNSNNYTNSNNSNNYFNKNLYKIIKR